MELIIKFMVMCVWLKLSMLIYIYINIFSFSYIYVVVGFVVDFIYGFLVSSVDLRFWGVFSVI